MRSAKHIVARALLTVLIVGATTASPAWAQRPSAMREIGLLSTGPGTFTIDVEGADLPTVIRAISEFSGRNIVPAKDVSGRVSVSLRNVGWADALRTALRSQGYDFVEEGGILRVDEQSKLENEEVERQVARAKAQELVALETRIVKINYANARELGTALMSSLSKRGQIQVDARTNSLIISDLSRVVERVERMAIDLDTTTPQIEITAKLVDVDASALRNLGIQWNAGVVDEKSEFFRDFADAPLPGQAFNPGDDTEQLLAGQHKSTVADPTTTITYGIFKSWGMLEAQLQMLEENRKANIISNPRITTVDNREAKILVGQKIPLIVQDVAGNPVSQLQTIGIQLRVTPHLTQDQKIILDLHPEVSDLSTQSTVQGGVIINTSEADTRVMVEDGQTAVIGGLIRTNESNVVRGVPLLKDLPLLGNLFRSTSKVRQNRELIIFVTPRLVTDLASR
jgi:type IV pilus assembly protein PilQ